MQYNFSIETSKHMNYCSLWLRVWSHPKRSLLFLTAGHQTDLLTAIITYWQYMKPYSGMLKDFLCLQLFVVTFWAWNSYFSEHIKSTGVSNSSSPFSARKALQNHLTHWRSNYLPVYWRCEGKFPKWHTILWMFMP